MNLETQEKRETEPSNGQMLLYKADDGRIRIETRMHNETIRMNLNQMAALFGVDKSGISRHLKNIFKSGELERDSVVANFATTASDGKNNPRQSAPSGDWKGGDPCN